DSIQPLEHRCGRERAKPRCSELDGQGQPIETATDLDDDAGVVLVDGEPGVDRLGPVDEQRDGRESEEVVWQDVSGGRGQIERRHADLALTLEPERGPARGQNTDP